MTFELRTQMNQTGAELDETISEPEVAGLAMAPSRIVKPPRVALPPVALECTYCQTVVLTGSDGKTTGKSVVIVEVNIYIDHRVIAWMFDVRRMRGSLGSAYMDYCVVDDVFTMQRVSAGAAPGMCIRGAGVFFILESAVCAASEVPTFSGHLCFRLSLLTHPYLLVDL